MKSDKCPQVMSPESASAGTEGYKFDRKIGPLRSRLICLVALVWSIKCQKFFKK